MEKRYKSWKSWKSRKSGKSWKSGKCRRFGKFGLGNPQSEIPNPKFAVRSRGDKLKVVGCIPNSQFRTSFPILNFELKMAGFRRPFPFTVYRVPRHATL